MIDNHRVIAWTPYGRRPTYSILIEYLRRDVERGLLDEVWAYMNVDLHGQESDVAYAHELAEQYPWFHIKYRPDGIPRHPGPKQRNTGFAYRYMTDPDAVYLRFDDDVVYVHPDTVANLVAKKLEMAPSMAIFPIIWNNALSTYFLQSGGVVPMEWGQVSAYCMDPVGWANGPFAVKMHEKLIGHIEAGTVEDCYLYQDFPLKLGDQFSVSCFASAGRDYAALPQPGVLIPDEEEHWHTVHRPRVTGQPNILVGNALVSHWSFFPQKPFLNTSGLLERYRDLADKMGA